MYTVEDNHVSLVSENIEKVIKVETDMLDDCMSESRIEISKDVANQNNVELPLESQVISCLNTVFLLCDVLCMFSYVACSLPLIMFSVVCDLPLFLISSLISILIIMIYAWYNGRFYIILYVKSGRPRTHSAPHVCGKPHMIRIP